MRTVSLQSNLIHTGDLILVNADHPYRCDIVRQELIPVNREARDIMLNNLVANSLSTIMKKFHGWDQIAAVSGWRSMEEQIRIYESSMKENGQDFTQKYVALPGHSEHQTGLAIDLALKQDHIDFIRPYFPYTGICQIFRQQALYYGFIERYPKARETDTGIAHEPWHFRYVGSPHAQIMADHNFVLEEYIAFLKKHIFADSPYQYIMNGKCISVSYLNASKSGDTTFEINDSNPYFISGNNIDGFIITQWRIQNGE